MWRELLTGGRLLIMMFIVLLFNNCAKEFNSSYNNVHLTIDSIAPANGSAGTPVRIYGKGFAVLSTDNNIYFNGVKAVADSGNAIGVLLVNAPANGTTGIVSVKYNNDSVAGPIFTYVILAPHIISISPATGYPFITITITGNNFSTNIMNDVVLFNNQKATVLSADTNRLQVQVPLPSAYSQAAIPVTVSVNGSTSNAVSFQYTNYVPVITNISPSSGYPSTQVTISGSNFLTDTSKMIVQFNGVKAAFVSATTTQLIVVAPKSSTGKVTVQIVPYNETATGPVFTYKPAPVITDVEYNGPFIITGQNFDSLASVVSIAGQVVTGFSYLNYGNGQQILSKANFVPATNQDNPVNIIVSVNNSNSNTYSFLFYPQIKTASPDTINANAQVTLQGLLFGTRTVTSSLKAFYYDANQNKVYMSPDPTVISWNTNTIQLTIPEYQSYVAIIQRSVFNIYLEVNVGSKINNIELLYEGH